MSARGRGGVGAAKAQRRPGRGSSPSLTGPGRVAGALLPAAPGRGFGVRASAVSALPQLPQSPKCGAFAGGNVPCRVPVGRPAPVPGPSAGPRPPAAGGGGESPAAAASS